MANKPNKRGFGHLRRLPSKRWQASYVGPDLARHNSPTTFATKGDAEAWLGAERNLVASGRWESPVAGMQTRTASSFSSYARRWLADRPLKPRTRDGYEHLLERYLLPVFGDRSLASITPSQVRVWWAGLNPSTPTVNARAYALLQAVLNTALADEEISANPCRIKSASNAPRAREIRPATVAELDTIVATLPEHSRAIALLCSWCALRIGEVLELRRKDVDLTRGTVCVDRSVAWVKGGPVAGAPTSAAGRRTVAIPPHVVPDAGFVGSESFHYTAVPEGGTQSQATVAISVRSVTPPAPTLTAPGRRVRPRSRVEHVLGQARRARQVLSESRRGLRPAHCPTRGLRLARLGATGALVIDETIYLSPADTGSSFGGSGDKYVYNFRSPA
ncbi:phage integrase family protein [Humibacillus xanthopallidus]|uniref:Phage integrase family protein n=1 Tax=Humibacillus xanthopallidus TaxID=412689 RepID=A0A543PQS1_9MICO|nr:site-specific integrase [Humibacillus xanthopallidus]TQN46415.1 phage integrase family protein [Humibacillus xanthopallidus]